MAEEFRFRLIDTAGSELEIVPHHAATITEGETISMSDGRPVEVIEVYDDEYGRDGGVEATLVVDVD